jgi:outer membrane protein insertion porin family
VDLRWVITEGQPAIVSHVEIRGNDVTHERVIREAIVMVPGDVFRQDALIASYQRVSNLGFFNQPMPFPDTKPANEQGDIDVVFRVSEKRTGNINFGASVGQGTGVGGFLGLDEPNLFGQGKRGRFQWQFGKNINDFDVSFTDPAVRESRISATSAYTTSACATSSATSAACAAAGRACSSASRCSATTTRGCSCPTASTSRASRAPIRRPLRCSDATTACVRRWARR